MENHSIGTNTIDTFLTLPLKELFHLLCTQLHFAPYSLATDDGDLRRTMAAMLDFLHPFPLHARRTASHCDADPQPAHFVLPAVRALLQPPRPGSLEGQTGASWSYDLQDDSQYQPE